MDSGKQQQTVSEPTLCHGGCGFFGSRATNGFCSKCFKTKGGGNSVAMFSGTGSISASSPAAVYAQVSGLVDGEDASEVRFSIIDDLLQQMISNESLGDLKTLVAQTSNENLLIASASASEESGKVGSLDEQVDADGVPSSKRNRCHQCNKRIGLLGFSCRCGGLYCAEHRYDAEHGCSFDYKTMERELIRQKNPVIAAEKIKRI